MLSNTITVEVTSNDSILKRINQERPVNTPLSSILEVIQTDVNDFLTYLVNKNGGDVEDFPDSGNISKKPWERSANDDSENEYNESNEEKKRSVKGAEENSTNNKKIKT